MVRTVGTRHFECPISKLAARFTCSGRMKPIQKSSCFYWYWKHTSETAILFASIKYSRFARFVSGKQYTCIIQSCVNSLVAFPSSHQEENERCENNVLFEYQIGASFTRFHY